MTQEKKTMDSANRSLLEERIVDVLKTVYDPEIPVNIYDLDDIQDRCAGRQLGGTGHDIYCT